MTTLRDSKVRRRRRVRHRLRSRNVDRARLSVFRSNKHIYAQLIDDSAGRTVATASTMDKGLREKLGGKNDKSAAGEVGKLLAERALAAGFKEVIFDRGSYIYHGRVKALADAAREGGLSF